MNKKIALDIGGVCIDLNYKKVLSSLNISSFEMLPPECAYAVNALETGKISFESFYRIINSELNLNSEYGEFLNLWKTIIGRPKKGIIKLLKDIKDAGFEIIFFSDTSEPHIEFLMNRDSAFSEIIDDAVYSYKVGAKKPEPEMYKFFERNYGQPFFYIDDKAINIKGGLKRKWNSCLFFSVEQIREEFSAELNNLKI